MKGSGLSDVGAISRHLDELRLGMSLRGIEAVVRGMLARHGDELVLLISGTQQSLTVRGLTSKVQWRLETKRAHPISRAERGAFGRLSRLTLGQAVEIVGTLEAEGKLPTAIQVRSFKLQERAGPR